LRTAIEGVSKETPEQSKERLERSRSMLSADMDRLVQKEIDKMDKGGMLNIKNMKYKNALD